MADLAVRRVRERGTTAAAGVQKLGPQNIAVSGAKGEEVLLKMIEKGSQCALTAFRVVMHSCGMLVENP